MGLRIRKSAGDLTAADLERFPVWVYALDEEGSDGQDETTVRPYRRRGQLDASRDTYIVRATFRLKNGRTFCGALYARPRGERTISDVQPAVLTPSGSVFFWWGVLRPKKAELRVAYRMRVCAVLMTSFPPRIAQIRR
jgi:hypothetical protein